MRPVHRSIGNRRGSPHEPAPFGVLTRHLPAPALLVKFATPRALQLPIPAPRPIIGIRCGEDFIVRRGLDMHDLEAAQKKQAEAAAKRVADAKASRQEKIDALRQNGGRARAIIGSEDFLGVSYLEAGVGAARAVGRVVIREGGQVAGFGTGSLVSPTLLLTNNHVLPSADVAEGSSIEFSFQDGLDGQPLDSAFLRPRSRPLLPDRRRSRLRARRRQGDAGRALRLRVQPADRRRGRCRGRRVRDDRPAPAGQEEADRLAGEPDRRRARLVPPLRGRHRAGVVGLAGLRRQLAGGLACTTRAFGLPTTPSSEVS